MAADRRDNEWLFSQANDEWDSGNLHEAFMLFLEAALNGDKSCQNSLGVFYECGYGIRRNFHKAMSWYRKSARDNNSSAVFNIAGLHRKMGNGKIARQWYERAVILDAGDGDACFELARYCMDTGRSNKKKIRRLLRMASGSTNITPYAREEAHRLLRGM